MFRIFMACLFAAIVLAACDTRTLTADSRSLPTPANAASVGPDAGTPEAQDEIRLALVIDQSNYMHKSELAPIPFAPSEAELIEAALRETGFSVTRVSDRTKAELVEALDAFRIKLEQAGAQAVGFVYYTGHGAQHPQSRSSYLLGTDARLRAASDLGSYGVSLEEQRDSFALTGAKAVFLVFDACRNVATASDFKTSVKGINRVDARSGMLIAYSTDIGEVAEAGIYAPILAEEILRSGQTAYGVFENVQQRVVAATQHKQRPWFDPRAYETVCFNGCEAPSKESEGAEEDLDSEPIVVFRDKLSSGRQGPEMAILPSGEFLMGSPPNELNRHQDEGPQRRVRINYQLAVSRYEVTMAEYRAFSQDTSRVTIGPCATIFDLVGAMLIGHTWENTGYPQAANHPVACVSWHDANAYAAWLSLNTGHEYRLLSEAEWEFAARAGTKSRYHFGQKISEHWAQYGHTIEEMAEYGRKSKRDRQGGTKVARSYKKKGGTAPVGSFRSNAFGLNDMHGNISEWVTDCYESSYSIAPSDGTAYDKKSCTDRVIRGGNWYNWEDDARSASRSGLPPGFRDFRVGFRVARVLPTMAP